MTRIRPRSMVAPALISTEAQLQAAVIAQARSLGWGVTLSARRSMLEETKAYGVEPPPLDGLVFHPRYSLGSEPGWPDLTLIRRRDRRLVFAELKAEKGRLSDRQAEVLELLRCLVVDLADTSEVAVWPRDPAQAALGHEHAIRRAPRIEVHVWRPSHLTSGAIEEVLR